jgi:two-component system response regulator HydG
MAAKSSPHAYRNNKLFDLPTSGLYTAALLGVPSPKAVSAVGLYLAAMTKKALLVAADPSSQEQCARVLRDCACEVTAINSGAAALALLGSKKFETVLVDFRVASQAGMDFLAAAQRAQPGINIILMVEGIGVAPTDEVPRLRGYPLLTKPLKIEDLTRALDAPSEPAPASAPEVDKAAPASDSSGFAGLVGVSDKMKRIYRLISKVALQRHPVLIMGESGTGKELAARAIHTQGPWRDQPYVPVDCGALPPTLIESELFGHVKGAFTGAAQSRQGLLATAGSGTVFLDEIGELPIELQSRLLRVLQEREIRPLGSNERIRFEARVIAATNQDLEAAIKSGAFRKDLFFRLNVVSIKMPALRDRKDDIPVLARHFLARCGNEKAMAQITDEALGGLMSYHWPGNIRELENCVQRAVSLGSGTYLQLQDLPSAMLYHLGRKSSSRQDLSSLQALEQQAIRQALQATGGDRVRAAKLLGIGKTTIYRKLKEYAIDANPPEA